MATKENSFAQSVWDFFCSLKLTISLLISLALTSIIGTVIPQGQIPPEYINEIGQLRFQIYSKMGFFDMYSSWWFVLLLYIFSLNLICCSIKRLPHVFTFISSPMLVLGEGLRNSFQLKQELSFKAPVNQASASFVQFLSKEFAAPVVTEQNGEFHLFAQKSPWCRLGVYVVHFSILVIFIGAIVGSLFGSKGFVNIVEGETATSIMARNGSNVPLGFGLRCEKFSVAFYETGAPKEFKSIMTVIDNGVPVKDMTNVRVIVNEPLTYKGFTFYQSSYGSASEGGEHGFIVKPKSGGTPDQIKLRAGASITLKDGTGLKLLETTQDIRPFQPAFSGPAARVQLFPKGKEPITFIVYKDFPDVNAQRDDAVILDYTGSDAKMYTGLQVAKDPGVWVVWLGCALMVVGIFIAFFMSHKRVWIVLSNGSARMYGNASKNQAAFSMQFDELAEKFKNLKI